MLALTDAALARLVRGAREVPRRLRGRWLRELAAKLDPPTTSTAKNVASVTISPQVRTPAAARQAKLRARRKNGQHHYGMWLSDRAVEGLIMRLVLDGRLSEAQAMRPKLVALALAQLLEEEGQLHAL